MGRQTDDPIHRTESAAAFVRSGGGEVGAACTVLHPRQNPRASGPPRGAAPDNVTPKEPTDIDMLIAYAEGYAEFAMKNAGRVPPTMLAVAPDGLLHFLPEAVAVAVTLPPGPTGP